ncbi:MAG: DUF4347 domain-containing protein [Magnetococcales bacterium]|nr:DUF4347 domain-containing protein [Magnetococcales bacterium]
MTHSNHPAGKSIQITPLEPRLMFDGALSLVADLFIDTDISESDASETDFDTLENSQHTNEITERITTLAGITETETQSNRQLLIIDASVSDTDSLTQRFSPDTHVIILPNSITPLEDIANQLVESEPFDQIHIVSHGAPGVLTLGGQHIDSTALNHASAALIQWQNSLNNDADILLYGCDVAKGDTGITFVETLAHLTGADVAASVDATGNAAQDGDWDLEQKTGDVTPLSNSAIQALTTYQYLLADTAVGSGTNQISGEVDLNFDGHTLISGTDLEQGAVYRFDDVTTGYDALVSIDEIANGASLAALDFSSGGFANAFQPKVIGGDGAEDSWIEFTITFVLADTDTPTHLAEQFIATSIDVDGSSGQREYVAFDQFTEYTLEDNTALTHEIPGRISPIEAVDAVGESLSLDDTTHMLTVRYQDTESLTYRSGVLNSNGLFRYFSLYFSPVSYTDPTTIFTAPELDLDPDNSLGGAGDGNITNTFIEDGDPATLADSDATIDDLDYLGAVGSTLSTFTISYDSLPDGSDEVIVVGDGDFPLDTDASTMVTANGLSLQVDVSATDQKLVVRDGSGGTMSRDDVQTLLRTISYKNNSQAPTIDQVRLFEIRVNDGLSDAIKVTSTISVQEVNDPPIIHDLDGDTLNHDTADTAVILDQSTAASVSDVDSPEFNTGVLTISGGATGTIYDTFSVESQGDNSGEIGRTDNEVRYGGTAIGTMSGGTGGDDLLITLNENASQEAVSALIGRITYQTGNIIGGEETVRTVSFTVTDGEGGLSNTAEVSLTVTGSNSAPDLTNNGGGTSVAVSIDEPTKTVTTLTAVDIDDDPLTYEITGGPDADLFNLDPTSQLLSFITAPNWELPLDQDSDNVYVLEVMVSDPTGAFDTQTLTITVNDVFEPVSTEISSVSNPVSTPPIDGNQEIPVVLSIIPALTPPDILELTSGLQPPLSGVDSDTEPLPVVLVFSGSTASSQSADMFQIQVASASTTNSNTTASTSTSSTTAASNTASDDAGSTETQSFTLKAKDAGGDPVQISIQSGLPFWMKIENEGEGLLKTSGERPSNDDKTYKVLLKIKSGNGREVAVVVEVAPADESDKAAPIKKIISEPEQSSNEDPDKKQDKALDAKESKENQENTPVNAPKQSEPTNDADTWLDRFLDTMITQQEGETITPDTLLTPVSDQLAEASQARQARIAGLITD